MSEKTVDNFLSDLSNDWGKEEIEEANIPPAESAKRGKAFAQAVQRSPKAQKAIGDMLATAVPDAQAQTANGQPAPAAPAPGSIGAPTVPANPGAPKAPTGQPVTAQQNPLGIGSSVNPAVPGIPTTPQAPGKPNTTPPSIATPPGQPQPQAVVGANGTPQLDAKGRPIRPPLVNGKVDLRRLSQKLNDEMHN